MGQSTRDSQVQEEIAKTRQFFDKSRPPQFSGVSPVQEYVFAVTSKLIPPGRPGTKAVDLGCHWGRYSKILATTYGDVIGVDFSEKAIASAEKAPNIAYIRMDLNARESGLRALAPVDFFLANAVFEMLEEPARLCAQVAQCSGRDAVILAVIPNRRSLNYITFRAALWVATTMLGKRGGIYNNGITISSLVANLEAVGFTVESRGSILGVPPYLASLMPEVLQRMLLKLDLALLRLIGGSYHWVRAQKISRPDVRE